MFNAPKPAEIILQPPNSALSLGSATILKPQLPFPSWPGNYHATKTCLATSKRRLKTMTKKTFNMSTSIQALKDDATQLQTQVNACKIGPDTQHIQNNVRDCTEAYERVAKLLEKTERTSRTASAFRCSITSTRDVLRRLFSRLRQISRASLSHSKWAIIGDSKARDLYHELNRHTTQLQELAGLLEECV